MTTNQDVIENLWRWQAGALEGGDKESTAAIIAIVNMAAERKFPVNIYDQMLGAILRICDHSTPAAHIAVSLIEPWCPEVAHVITAIITKNRQDNDKP